MINANKSNENNLPLTTWGVCPVRPSFREVQKQVLDQISFSDLKLLNEHTAAEYYEIALIITEVYLLKPHKEIKIDGSMLSVDMVQEVFQELRSEHVSLVADKFCKINYEITNKKAYLRTALYNSVFEKESHWTNQVQKDLNINR